MSDELYDKRKPRVAMTPAQSNEIILEKLSLLEPKLERLRDDLERFLEEISNGGLLGWKAVLKRMQKF